MTATGSVAATVDHLGRLSRPSHPSRLRSGLLLRVVGLLLRVVDSGGFGVRGVRFLRAFDGLVRTLFSLDNFSLDSVSLDRVRRESSLSNFRRDLWGVLHLDRNHVCRLRYFCNRFLLTASLTGWSFASATPSLTAQLDGAGTGTGGRGKSLSFRGLRLGLVGQRPHVCRGLRGVVVLAHRNQFRVSNILAGAATHRSPARESGCS